MRLSAANNRSNVIDRHNGLLGILCNLSLLEEKVYSLCTSRFFLLFVWFFLNADRILLVLSFGFLSSPQFSRDENKVFNLEL